MPSVILQKDDAENISQNFTVGEHILGRGDLLQCTSKKVSRKHSIFNITADGNVTLKSTHNNPCFYKPNQSDNVSVLTFGNTIKINNNDKIALALDHGWFSVIIVKDEQNTDDESGLSQTDTAKRKVHSENESPSKKIKTDETVTDEGIKSSSVIADSAITSELLIKSEPITEAVTDTDLNSTDVKVKPDSSTNFDNIKTEPSDIKTENADSVEIKQESDFKQENNETEDSKDNKPSTSGTNRRPWRDRCWYGSACYRKNGMHRIEFKHPGDSDFESDTDDSRPVCCYGIECYRKNREHRRRYRHPGQTKLGTKPPPAPRKRRTVIPKQPPPMQDSEELDDYDYSDPFIDDGSEDEYEPSQETDTESEYEDSQEVDEDQQRLFREARKFTRKKK